MRKVARCIPVEGLMPLFDLDEYDELCDMTAANQENHEGHNEATAQVPTPRPSVSVLIVGYNTKDLVLDCLAGLFKHTRDLSFEVLFVNNSEDGSERAIRDAYPAVRVIDNTQNMGFGRGNNYLARHARGDYLLLLNPDTLVDNNAIHDLYVFAQHHPEGGAWGGVTRLKNGEIDPSCKQSGVGLGKSLLMLVGLSKLACPDVSSADAMDVASLSGAFMMMPRDLWHELGGFDESFFMYSEETDLCYRVRRTGRRVLITSRSSITHLVGSGSSQSPSRMLALTRGGMHLTRKHFGTIYVLIEASLRWLYSATRYLLGLFGAPLVGAERAAQLRARHLPIVQHPGSWFYGWAEASSYRTSSPKSEPNSV